MLRYATHPVVILLVIIVAGIGYSIYSGNAVLMQKPSQLDSKCYNVHIPESIPHTKAQLFCSCVHAGGHVSKQENYQYCVNKFNK